MKLRVPHTYVLLTGLMTIAALVTWLIPAGEYERVVEEGRELIAPATYHFVASDPAGLFDVIMAFPTGLVEVADIVFYIFIIGGAFGVLNRTGFVESGIQVLAARLRRRESLVVPLLTVVFAVGGGSIGIAEETLVFLPPLLMLSRSLGYDSLVAGGIALVGANAGFAAAFTNPFTVGVAQGIVGLPLFSGITFRLVLWAIISAVTVVFLSRYAARVKLNPASSPMVELDSKREDPEAAGQDVRFEPAHFAVLTVTVAAIVVLVVGAIRWGWGIQHFSALFFGLAVVAGPAGRLSLDETARSFIRGAQDITYAALVVGLARGTLVVLRDAHAIDTITHAMASLVQQWPASFSVVGIYIMQNLLNFIVPSGSGQAAVSMPILAPFGDLLGITRQTNVLAYQLGNGLTNIFVPTQGYFMAALGILGIPWTIWVRWLMPLLLVWLAIGLVAVLIAHAIHLGPF